MSSGIASYQSRLNPIPLALAPVWDAIKSPYIETGLPFAGQYSPNAAIKGPFSPIALLLSHIIALHFDLAPFYSADLAVLTRRDSLLHIAIDEMGLSRRLGERLVFHSDYPGSIPLLKGKRFRLLVVNSIPNNRPAKLYEILASQSQRMLIEARECDIIQGIGGQNSLERSGLFPLILTL